MKIIKVDSLTHKGDYAYATITVRSWPLFKKKQIRIAGRYILFLDRYEDWQCLDFHKRIHDSDLEPFINEFKYKKFKEVGR